MHELKKFKEGADETSATIISSEIKSGMRTVYYLHQLQYKTIDTGIVYNARAVTSSKKYQPGDTLPLMYLRNDPAKYTTDLGNRLRWLLFITLLLFSAMCLFCYLAPK